MQFINALLLRLYEDRAVSLSTAAGDVYHETLYKYHTWYTSAAFQLALKVGQPSPSSLLILLLEPARAGSTSLWPT